MTISEAGLAEFIQIYEQVYGERLSPEDARPIAARLIRAYELLMQPSPNETAALSEIDPGVT